MIKSVYSHVPIPKPKSRDRGEEFSVLFTRILRYFAVAFVEIGVSEVEKYILFSTTFDLILELLSDLKRFR